MQRAAIALHYLDDLSIKAVAQALGCAPATAKVHLHRARQRLGAILNEEFGDAAR
jgi:DNA-directed RNA polymerase specialized sigma24 family protein